MDNANFGQDEACLGQLSKEIRARKFAFWIFLAAALTFLIGFAFFPYRLGNGDGLLYMSIHLAIPIVCVASTLIIFHLAKRYFIEGMREKCMHPGLDERSNRPLMIFNFFSIANGMILGLAIPAILVLVLLEASATLLFVWGFLAVDTILATMEYSATKVLEGL